MQARTDQSLSSRLLILGMARCASAVAEIVGDHLVNKLEASRACCGG